MKKLPEEFVITSRDEEDFEIVRNFILPFLVSQGFRWRNTDTDWSPSDTQLSDGVQINYGGREPKVMSLGGWHPSDKFTAEEFKSWYIDKDFDQTIDNFLGMIGESEEDDWGWAEDVIKDSKDVLTYEYLTSVAKRKKIYVKRGPDWDSSYLMPDHLAQDEGSDYGIVGDLEDIYFDEETNNYWTEVTWVKKEKTTSGRSRNKPIHSNTYRVGPEYFDLVIIDPKGLV